MQLPRTALQVQRAEERKSSSRKLAQLGKQPLGVTDLLAEEDQSLFSTALEEDEADDEDSGHGEDGGEDNDTADELSPAGVVHLVLLTLVGGGGEGDKRDGRNTLYYYLTCVSMDCNTRAIQNIVGRA